MVWWVQPLEIANENGAGTGRWRLTAKSDEDGGGPFGDTSHDHATAAEAQACEQCDDFVSGITGFPSKRRETQLLEERERRELERLKGKYESSAPDSSDNHSTTGD